MVEVNGEKWNKMSVLRRKKFGKIDSRIASTQLFALFEKEVPWIGDEP
jgi:hypothetical protein